jgi:hypothetical protein
VHSRKANDERESREKKRRKRRRWRGKGGELGVCSLFLVLKMDGQSHSKLSHLGLLHRDILERDLCRGGIAAEGE